VDVAATDRGVLGEFAVSSYSSRTRRASIGRIAPLLLLFAGPAVHAEQSASTALMVYSDDDGVSVVMPSAEARADIGDFTLRGRGQVDIISAASVDLVSAASPRGFDALRAGGGFGGTYRWEPGHESNLSYSFSSENDFVQHGVGASHSIEVFARHTTLTAGYTYAHSDVGRAGDASFSRLRHTHEGSFTWTEVLGRASLMDLFVTFGAIDGFQSSPYRFVPLFTSASENALTSVPEVVPDLRLLGSVGGRVRGRIHDRWFASGELRGYVDSWGMNANSLATRVSFELEPDVWIVGFDARGYRQSGASFYRERYETFPAQPSLRTADKELGPMWTVLLGAHVDWIIPVGELEDVRLGLATQMYHLMYPEHPSLDSRTAVMSTFEVAFER
jgi:hypothetical protein